MTGEQGTTAHVRCAIDLQKRGAEGAHPGAVLKCISTGNFQEALEAILGAGAAGLSPAYIVRLKERCEEEHWDGSKRELTGKRYVYLWADATR